MGIKNKFNDIKSSVKLIGCVVVIFVMVAAMMLIARQYIIDQDSMYRQYIGSIRETGELRTSLEKMEAYLYHYVAMPSARNNTLESIKKETNSIDQIVQTLSLIHISGAHETVLDLVCRLLLE